ncbi:hypothetical protein EJB05_05005 [Eragrostis curvula]|uniref:Uncharacterized protein n=1 Tax=Eragrostis curvula TaxID=38414 RepID=A0A5J9WC03_9POAL|nr:hypothetical protein EJB05_05005 [Eragrostis curvula]
MAANNSPFDCVLLDLDDTLYPGNTGIGPALKLNIDEFLVAKLGVTDEESRRHARQALPVARQHPRRPHRKFSSHSRTMRLALGYDVHPDEYHSYVHGRLPYDRIAADPQVVQLLKHPQRKVLFTNSDRAHMKRALERLGVDDDIFNDIVCFKTMNPHLFGEERVNGDVAGERPLFLDDSERNITAGKALGLRTALVGKGVRSKDADYAMESIGSLRQVIPEIWGAVDVEKKGIRSELDSFPHPTTIQV